MKSLSTHHRRFVKGLTLIEMMVSITIGMIIVAAVLSMYGGASLAGKTAEAQGRMNEDAQAALTILTQQIRMAWANPKQPNRTAAVPRNPVGIVYGLRGCDGTFGNITSAANPQSLTCGGNTTTLPDSIAVSYEADRFNTVPTATTGAPTDCLGSTLTPITKTVSMVVSGAVSVQNVTYTVADNRFFIGTSAVITSPSLYCKGSNNPNEQPLVENIEDMQFTYGTSPAQAATGTVAGYLSAVGVETDATVLAGDTLSLSTLASSQARWARVITVRICVLARSEQPVATSSNSAKYTNCHGELVSAPDLLLRRAYYTTIVLRNKPP
jgi:type IV pilus assembly protein PilW